MFKYNKKLLAHFRNPKNHGRMKNPDGVGREGNPKCGDVMEMYIKVKNERISDIKFLTFGCLPPNEEILVNEGSWKAIAEVGNGWNVLNSKGIQTKVLGTSIRKYKGPILTLIPFVSSFNKFSVTSEHPILAIKRKWVRLASKSSKICQWLKIKEEELFKVRPKYVLAENLDIGDYLVFVPSTQVKDSPKFTNELVRLIGYYLAEGYSSSNSSVLCFAFNKKEKNYIQEVKSLLYKITGKNPKQRLRKSVIEIYICSRKWVSFFRSTAGSLAFRKKLSQEIMLLPFKKQWELLETYIRGDGNIYRRRINNFPTFRVATASKQLVIQIQEMLARGNIFSSIKKYSNVKTRSYIEGRKITAKPLYEISFRLSRKHKFVHSNGRYFLVPIKKIDKKEYFGNVHNIQIAGKPNSYLVKGFAVHNCVAAIGISSILTETIKGKTIEEAKKITTKELLKEVGEIPPVKYHCSVLGIQSLSRAIKDYERKKLNKNKKC